MVISQDNTPDFIIEKKPRLVILGTMVAICARTLDGQAPTEETFYYHNNRNHFWRVMQHLLEPTREPRKMTVSEKKKFLIKHRVVIANLVQEITVPNNEAHDPSDTILFKAHKKKRLKFKKVSKEVKGILEKTPKFFTCRSKKGIQDLVKGYGELNDLSESFYDSIWYLPTPTRCNPKARSLLWKQEMNDFGLKIKS